MWHPTRSGTVDEDLSARIRELIAQEHALRAQDAQSHQGEADRLAAIEVQLDVCWDLLRQRRARRDFGQDPTSAQARSEAAVEHYLRSSEPRATTPVKQRWDAAADQGARRPVPRGGCPPRHFLSRELSTAAGSACAAVLVRRRRRDRKHPSEGDPRCGEGVSGGHDGVAHGEASHAKRPGQRAAAANQKERCLAVQRRQHDCRRLALRGSRKVLGPDRRRDQTPPPTVCDRVQDTDAAVSGGAVVRTARTRAARWRPSVLAPRTDQRP
jgi:hypothetical protein